MSRKRSPLLTPAQRKLRAQIAANARWAKAAREQREANAARARANSPADVGYWANKLDPEHALPDDERLRRGENARREYFQRLALASLRARSREAEGGAA